MKASDNRLIEHPLLLALFQNQLFMTLASNNIQILSGQVDGEELLDIADQISASDIPIGKKLAQLADAFNVSLNFEISATNDSIKSVRDKHHRENNMVRLLQASAPFSMLKTLYNISQDEYRSRRRELNLLDLGGRPKILSDEAEEILAEKWNGLIASSRWWDIGEAFISLQRATKSNMRDIWPYFTDVISNVLDAETDSEGFRILPYITSMDFEQHRKSKKCLFIFKYCERPQEIA